MTHQGLWGQTYKKLKESLPEHAINTWFEPVVPVAISDGELILEVPNQFFYEWIDSHYSQTISVALKESSNNRTKYRFIVSKNGQKMETDDFNSATKITQSKSCLLYTSPSPRD